jgi:hypothetical protein
MAVNAHRHVTIPVRANKEEKVKEQKELATKLLKG